MFSAEDFRRFSAEAIASARRAKSESEQKHHLDMARMWAKAAAKIDGSAPIAPLATAA